MPTLLPAGNTPKPRAEAAILADLTASRMVHEVVGPVGAIANGLELIDEKGEETGKDATALVAASAREAGLRLQFYRMAYGRAGFGVTDLAQLRAAATGLFDAAPHHDLAWPLPPVPPSLGHGTGRLILILAEIAKEVLPRGGTVRIAVDDDAVTVLAGNGDTALPPELHHAISGMAAATDLTPRTVHGALARIYAEDIGWVTRTDEDRGELLLSASKAG